MTAILDLDYSENDLRSQGTCYASVVFSQIDCFDSFFKNLLQCTVEQERYQSKIRGYINPKGVTEACCELLIKVFSEVGPLPLFSQKKISHLLLTLMLKSERATHVRELATPILTLLDMDD